MCNGLIAKEPAARLVSRTGSSFDRILDYYFVPIVNRAACLFAPQLPLVPTALSDGGMGARRSVPPNFSYPAILKVWVRVMYLGLLRIRVIVSIRINV